MRFLNRVYLTAALICLATLCHAQEGDKPNVVLILMDNLGYGELGSYGGGALRGAPTPNLDTLAEEGFRLTNFNTETQCTPSRASILTGRYAIRTGNASIPISSSVYGLVQWEHTIAEMFSELGYSTAMFGKWHLGHTEGRFPTDQGFDVWYGIPNSSDEAQWPGSPDFDRNVGGLIQPTYVMEAKKGETPKKVKIYDQKARSEIEKELAERAINFIEASAEKEDPFFLYLPFTQIHSPILPGTDFDGLTGNGHYADVLAEMDANVGRVLSALDDNGLRDDTIVIFTGDNGAESNEGHQGPFRGKLFSPYEGGLRTPFIIRWPKNIPNGAVSNEIIHGMDIFPTLASMVGGKVPDDRPIDGVDQSAFLRGKSETSAREGFAIYIGQDLVGVKWRQWKVLSSAIDNAFTSEPEDAAVSNYSVPRIYNLLSDPRESKNINISSTWVRWPAAEIVGQLLKSFQVTPPIKPGTQDPYLPNPNEIE